MTQKDIKIGSSAGVTISKKALEELGLAVGDMVRVHVDAKQRVVRIEPQLKNVDRDVLEWTDSFIKRYRSALESLAKK